MDEEERETAVTAVVREIVWQAQEGPQTALIECPIMDIMFGGARGGGKTDALFGDWLEHQRTEGANARGVFFRRHERELEEAQKRAEEIFLKVGAYYTVSTSTWHFPNDATLKMRYLDRDADAQKYKGQQFTWMAFDEADNFPSPQPIDKLRACLRSAKGRVRGLILTANPMGLGHKWLKERYITPSPPMTPFYCEKDRTWRVFIPSKLEDNKILMANDPGYEDRIIAAGSSTPGLAKAWRRGSWDDPPQGGMLQPSRLVRLPMTAQELIAKYGLRCRIYIDLATKEKERDNDDPDLSCICVMAKDALKRIHILYMWADQVSMDKTARQLIAVRKLFKAEKVKGEKIGLQYAFRSILRQTCQLTGNSYFHVDDLSTAGGKEHRATALEGLLNLGVLCVPAAASWLDAMVEDWALFPHGRFKDRIDAPAYGASDLQSIPEGMAPLSHPMLDDSQIDDEVMRQVHKRIAKARAEARGEDTGSDDDD